MDEELEKEYGRATSPKGTPTFSKFMNILHMVISTNLSNAITVYCEKIRPHKINIHTRLHTKFINYGFNFYQKYVKIFTLLIVTMTNLKTFVFYQIPSLHWLNVYMPSIRPCSFKTSSNLNNASQSHVCTVSTRFWQQYILWAIWKLPTNHNMENWCYIN